MQVSNEAACDGETAVRVRLQFDTQHLFITIVKKNLSQLKRKKKL